MKLAPEEINTMKALEAQASKGEWHCIRQGEEPCYDVFSSIDTGSRYICEMNYAADNAKADGDFIAASRTFVPRAIAHIRFTEASTQEALLILDDAQANAGTLTDAQLLQMMDAAAQKLRGVQVSPEDADLVALPWMDAAPMVVVGTPSNGPSKCSPLSCDGCQQCQKGGETAPEGMVLFHGNLRGLPPNWVKRGKPVPDTCSVCGAWCNQYEDGLECITPGCSKQGKRRPSEMEGGEAE